jgi:hypothetical protein
MIILSVGMPRAGSGWHYNLIRDLMKTAGAVDAPEIRKRFHLEKVLTEVNCNIGVLSARRLAQVCLPALLGNTFVIKAHSQPSLASRLLSRMGLLRITYIYRDPRDCMLSAFDYGKRALQRNRPNAFSHLIDFDASLVFITTYVNIWQKWIQEKNLLIARYEDLLTDYDRESARLTGYLRLDGAEAAVQEVIERYRPGAGEPQRGTHYFKGKIGRFREAYSPNELQILQDRLGNVLTEMGYPV